MKQRTLALLFLLASNFSKGQEFNYAVGGIPEELKQGVDAVIRINNQSFKILARDKAVYHVHFVATILNSNGTRLASEVIGYDKHRKITMFKGTAYDALGNQLKKLKNADIYDQSAWDGVSLYSDNRLKAADLTQGVYPYTVEFEYEIDFSYLFHIPPYVPIPNERSSLMSGSFKLIYPVSLKPRYKAINISKEPTVSREGETETAKWQFNNVKPFAMEPHGPPAELLLPHVIAAPSSFQFDSYKGNMETWDEFGQWIGQLNRQRQELPLATRQRIAELTKNLSSEEEKVRVVYEYMQSRTRYVGIQLGIGGFQPFPASVVDETGYGDCKALSNYTIALLQAAGIRSNYVLIEAGPTPTFQPDFVSSQFNHAIVAVPLAQDTIWLECTSQSKPAGYMGGFTGDRQALMITDQGARVVRTVNYDASQNRQIQSAHVVVDAAGNGKAEIKTLYTGLQTETHGLDAVINGPPEEQKKWIRNNTHVPAFELTSYRMALEKARMPKAHVEAAFDLKRLASVSGKRLFVTPNVFNRSSFLPPKLEKRATPIVTKSGHVQVDTVHLAVPENLYPEFVPEPVKITSRFGEYEMRIQLDENGIVMFRRLKVNKGTFPPESYQEFVDFYKNVNKADNTKMVFLSKT